MDATKIVGIGNFRDPVTFIKVRDFGVYVLEEKCDTIAKIDIQVKEKWWKPTKVITVQVKKEHLFWEFFDTTHGLRGYTPGYMVERLERVFFARGGSAVELVH